MSVSDRWTTVDVGRSGTVGRITLSRPDAMNTFNTQLAGDLDEALWHLDERDSVRAIVVDGSGDAFSAGIDLSEHEEYDSTAEYESWVSEMEEPFLTIPAIETPVIAAAHGHAAANGIGLVAACDLAVAARGTRFGATAPKVGLFCMGPAVPIRESLPRKRSLELLLTGDLVDADTALDWGLLNRVVDEGEHVEEGLELAASITANSPVAVGMGKDAFYDMESMPYDEALAYSNERFADLCDTADAEEGISAFLAGEPLGPDEWPED